MNKLDKKNKLEKEIIDKLNKNPLKKGIYSLNPNPEFDSKNYKTSLLPNIIHSFDATHMQLIIDAFVNIKEGREDFFAVHDCFGSHAGDFEKLKGIVTKTFYELYKNLNLETFIEQIILDKNNKFGPKIKQLTHREILNKIKNENMENSLNIELVKNSEFMIS